MPDETNVASDLADVIEKELRDVLEGASEDMRTFGVRIAANALAAAASGRADLVAESRATARMLAEVQRLRAVDGQWDVFERVMGTLFGALAAVHGRTA